MIKKIILFGAIILALVSCSDDNVNNSLNYTIIEPDGTFYGKTYNEWSIDWWQWVLSMPKDAHPLMDNAPASKEQPEHLWFIGGTLGFSENGLNKITERTISIPHGKAIFIPVYTIMTPASLGYARDSLEILCEIEMEHFDELYCEINGNRISDIEKYKFASDRLFSYTVPDNSIFDIPEGTYEDDAYALGYYILLDNLDKGEHTVKFYARQDQYDYLQDVTYQIKIE